MTGNFSSDLNEAFSMDKDLNGLVQSVEQKYVRSLVSLTWNTKRLIHYPFQSQC